MKTPKRSGRVGKHAVLVGGGFLAGGLLCEAALRILAPFAPLPLRALLEEEAAPSAAYALRVAQGARPLLRESDFTLPTDIVALGDSMTFGSLVADGDIFTTRLSRETGLRVLNLGLPSAGPCGYAHMLDVALEHLPRPPRTILYVLFANDIVEGPCRPMRDEDLFVWESSLLTNRSLSMRRAREKALGGSVVYQLVKRWLSFRSLQAGTSFRPILFENGAQRFAFAPPDYWKAQTDQRLPIVASGLEQTLGKLAAAHGRAVASGSTLTLVLMPCKEQVFLPDLVARNRIARAAYDPAPDDLYDTLAVGAGERQIPVLDLRAGLRKAASTGEKLYFTLDGHLTPQGHGRVAELLRAWLVGNGQSSAPRPLRDDAYPGGR